MDVRVGVNGTVMIGQIANIIPTDVPTAPEATFYICRSRSPKYCTAV